MSSDATPPPGNLETARKAVEDTAAIGGGLWLSYLFVLFYLAIAAGAVTHADLLLQNPVKLPFLNIELPLLAFFFLAPLLFLVTHAYTLVHLVLLANRVGQFNDELRVSSDDHALWRRRLPSNIFVQFLGAPKESRYGPFGLLLGAILWVTLVVAPIALYLLLQIQFLPYHSSWITWTGRIALILDLGLLWWLWREILKSRAPRPQARSWKPAAKTAAGGVLTMGVILLSSAVVTFPGEWQEDRLPGFPVLTTLREWIFAGEVDLAARRRKSPFSNTLVLPGFNIYEALKIDDPNKVEWKETVIDLSDRDLNGAVLIGAVLTKTNFLVAQLRGAWLDGARLQGAQFTGAQLQGASLTNAQLQGASLDVAGLQGASLENAQLQGASLYGGELRGASLKGAQLQGASLFDAQLQGASLKKAQLRGASLMGARLQGAALEGAQLEGASLAGAFVWRAQLGLDVSRSKNLFAPYRSQSLDWYPEQNDKRDAWTNDSYAALRRNIEQVVPEGEMRTAALDRLAILDCGRKGETLTSCDSAADPPAAVGEWKKMIDAASVDDAAYGKALATIRTDLVCSNEPEVLRGMIRSNQFYLAGSEMPALAKYIMGSECLVSTMLTNADKLAIAKASAEVTAAVKTP
jgi:uncharacterized protein YjbI with pentapeptide repeats